MVLPLYGLAVSTLAVLSRSLPELIELRSSRSLCEVEDGREIRKSLHGRVQEPEI